MLSELSEMAFESLTIVTFMEQRKIIQFFNLIVHMDSTFIKYILLNDHGKIHSKQTDKQKLLLSLDFIFC